MPQSATEKARTLGLATVHDLFDGFIDRRKPSVVAQHIRDLSNERDKVNQSVANKRGDITGLERALQVAQKDEAVTENRVTLLVTAGKDAEAEALAVREMELEAKITELQEKIAAERASIDDFVMVVNAMSARIEEFEESLEDLRAMEEDAKSKESAARSINNAAEVLGSFDGSGIDNLLAKSQKRADRADATLDQAMGQFKEQTPAKSAEKTAQSLAAAERVALLKARLAGNAGAIPAGSAS